jgi:DNA-binding transcriptional LysR family regulator
MEYRQLMNFLALCEEKSFTRAAERRHITQQGLSWSVAELEKELGIPLFDRRRGKTLLLTEYGETLERAAKAYINQHDYILETIKSMKEKNKNRLSIGLNTDYTFLPFFPPHFLADFIAEHPGIDLSIKTFPLDLCQQSLREQSLQIGFSYPPIDTDVFEVVSLRKDRLCLVVNKTHPMAKRRSVKIAELRNEKVIFSSSVLQPNAYVMDLCRRNGIVPRTELGALDLNLIMELCSTGRFVAFAGERMGTTQGMATIDIEDEEIFAEFFLLVNRRAFINRAAETFIDYAKEKLRPPMGP